MDLDWNGLDQRLSTCIINLEKCPENYYNRQLAIFGELIILRFYIYLRSQSDL